MKGMPVDRSVRIPRSSVLLLAMVAAYLLAFAIRFADERLYADSGYYLIRTLNEGAFRIEHGRWVLALAEWLPWAGAQSGLPMAGIITLHSLGNVAFLLTGAAFALLVLRDGRAALALAALQLIGLAHGLFCPVFELYYGCGLIVLLLTTIRRNGSATALDKLGAALLLLLALSSHPMAWLLAAGALQLEPRANLRCFRMALLPAALAFASIRAAGMSAYEAAQLSFIQRLAFPDLVLGLFAPDELARQAARFMRHYPDVLAIAAFTAVILWREGQWRKGMAFVLGWAVLYVLTCLYLPSPDHDRYREQVDFGFAAWSVLALLFHAWDHADWRPAIVALLATCMLFRAAEAERVAPFYTARTAWHASLIRAAHEQGMRKAVVDLDGIGFGAAGERVAPYWSTAIEGLLLSAREGPEAVVALATTDDLRGHAALPNDRIILRRWDVMPVDYFNARWFRLPADEPYRMLREP